MTGIDFLKSVRAHDLDVPVILMTGNPTVESAAGAVEYGAFRYLAKPVPPDELCTTVLHASRLHKLARLKAEAMLLPGGHGDSSHQSRRGDGHEEGNDMVSESDGAARRELCVGDVVGERYLLRRELGRGAGGVVFEAIQYPNALPQTRSAIVAFLEDALGVLGVGDILTREHAVAEARGVDPAIVDIVPCSAAIASLKSDLSLW